MSTKKRGRDFESNYLAMRRRMQSLGTAIIPAPATIGAHTHHAREIVSDPFDITAADDVQEAIEELTTEKLARSGVQPMLGNLNLNAFYIYTLGALRFDKATVIAKVDGGLQWADAAGVERLVMTAAGDSGNVDMPVGGVYVKAKNSSGVAIGAGVPVVLSGADGAGNILTIVKADITVALNNTVALGVTMQSIANGAKGWVCRLGYVGGLNLTAFTDGLQLYVNGPGTMSGTAPAKGCGSRIRMGQVIDNGNPGSLWVDPDWRPDLDELANVAIGEYAAKQHYDVPMWLPRPDGEPCNAWRDVPASRWPAVEAFDDYAVDVKDVVILVRANSAAVTITLPIIQDATHDNRNRWVRVKKIQGAFNVIVAGSGGQLIDGAASVTLTKVGEVLDVQAISIGFTRWEIVGRTRPGGSVEATITISDPIPGLVYSVTVTGQSWVTSTSKIVCSLFAVANGGTTLEMATVSGMVVMAGNRVAGVGFDIFVYNPNGAVGTFTIHAIGD